MNEKNIDIVYQKTLDELNHKPKQEDKDKQVKCHIFGKLGDNLYCISRKSHKFKGKDIVLVYCKDDGINSTLQILSCMNGLDENTYIIMNLDKFKPIKYCVPLTIISFSNMLIQLRNNKI